MKMNAIHWPEAYTPGFTDNFCSNEVIVAGLSAAEIWPLLVTPARWNDYYPNAEAARFYDNKGPELAMAVRFYFETFGFPVEAEVTEFSAPVAGEPGRVSWHGWAGEEGSAERLDVLHAWLVEDLPGQRVRILTQEVQKGEPAVALAKALPNPMINGHQAWLDGLAAAARQG